MKPYNTLEYCNVAVWFDRTHLNQLMQSLVQSGFDIGWKESVQQFSLQIITNYDKYVLKFDKNSQGFKLTELDYAVRDMQVAMVLYQFIEQAKGHAIIKLINENQIVVKNIRYGEAVRIVEIKGAEKKVIYEKACSVTMDQVIAALKRRDAEERIPVLRLELDYELSTLYDAIQSNDTKQVEKSKDMLRKLRREMLLLEV
ncbi:hypothetical protein [Brevibacillus sp. SYSU BS000544]|uniref:hypothetical protein n=1 Tax=Brevibacillus sp. SYSU BS000544 TaxID=3416443 RepID=UPI003CE4CC9C